MNIVATDSKKFKLAYCAAVVDSRRPDDYKWIYDIKNYCESLVVGIPDESIIARLFGDDWQYSADEIKKFLLENYEISKVIVLDSGNLSYQKVHERVSFDACFYGSEYGIPFESDRQFMKAHNIAFLSLIPQKRLHARTGGALGIALEDVQRHQKIVLFGTGVYFDAYIQEYVGKHKPAYAIDNNRFKWNTKKCGIIIRSPDSLLKEKAEDILVIICSKNYVEMADQLKTLGNFNYRTLLFQNDIALLEEFSITSQKEKRYLIRSHEILIELISEFNRVCQKYNLRYYVICGSLIGAVRHKGFIPWDDDMDIAMTRKDYKKLRKIAKKEWLDKKFLLVHYDELGGGAFLDFMPRLFYMREHLPTKVFTKVCGKATADVEDRLFLDIYIMDHAHNNQKLHKFFMYLMKGVYNFCMGHRAVINYDEYRVRYNECSIALMKTAHMVGRCMPLKFWTFFYELFSRSANLKKGCTYYFMNACAITVIERKYAKKLFGEGQMIPFEDIEVMAPEDCDGVLNAMLYHNYMDYPRLSVQKPSHYFNSDIEIW